MVIDTSAIVAILFARWKPKLLPKPSIVVESELGAEGRRERDAWLQTIAISIEPVTTEQLAAARHAFRNFGKGRHPAALDFGDCFSDVLSKSTGEPLLFTVRTLRTLTSTTPSTPESPR